MTPGPPAPSQSPAPSGRPAAPLRVRWILAAAAAAGAAVLGLLLLQDRPAATTGSAEHASARPEPSRGASHGPALAGWDVPDEVLRARRAREAWERALTSEDPAERSAALARAGEHGLAPEALARIVLPLLTDASSGVRLQARALLHELGAPSVKVLLRDGLRSTDWELPALAIQVLGELAWRGLGDVDAVRATLLEVLGDDGTARARREAAAVALGLVRPVTAQVRTALEEALLGPGYEVPASALEALGMLGDEGRASLPVLLRALEPEHDAELQREVRERLQSLEVEADIVLERLLRLDPAGRDLALEMASFGRSALPWLARLLEAGPDSARRLVLDVLSRLDPEDVQGLIPVLVRHGRATSALAAPVLHVLRRQSETRPPWVHLHEHARLLGDWLRALPGPVEPVVPDGTSAGLVGLLSEIVPEGLSVLAGVLESGPAAQQDLVLHYVAFAPGEVPRLRAAITQRAQQDQDERQRQMALWWLEAHSPRTDAAR